MKKYNPKIVYAVLLALSGTPDLALAGPFVSGGSAPSVQSQPASPFVSGGSAPQCGTAGNPPCQPDSVTPSWTPPLASPAITSSGVLTAFLATGLSQSNPNSPQPPPPSCTAQGKYGGPGTSTGTYVWSGVDNTGWVLTGADCATSGEPPTSCPSGSDTGEDGSSPGSYTWNGSSWAGYGPTCTDAPQDAAQAAAALVAQQAAAQAAAALAAQQAAAAQQATALVATSAPTAAPYVAPTAAPAPYVAPTAAPAPVLESYSCSGYSGGGIGQGAGTLYPVCSTSLATAGAFTGPPVSSVLNVPATPGNVLSHATSTQEGSNTMSFAAMTPGATLTFTCYTPKTGFCVYSGSSTVPG
jgi:hypothetical protein